MLPFLLACAAAPTPAPVAAAAAPVAADAAIPHALYAAAGQSTVAYERLEHLSDHIGARIAGSPQLEAAVTWARDTLQADGFQVSLEPVEVPVWERGAEAATLLAPVQRDLAVLGLGHTPGTPQGGIEAEVLVVDSFDALAAQPDEAVAGRIVLYDVPFTTYGETVRYRTEGPDVAARRGAVAALVRSVTSHSLYTPHTGIMAHAEDAPAIPAAALTVEDAAWLHRLQDDGVTPRLRLSLGGRMLGTATSHNVVADLPGRDLPDEVVVLGCHLDSWDVGQGAQDDGAGCLVAWEAARLIAARPQRPRRTVRVVLYTAEEIGILGGAAYSEARSDSQVAQHVALFESDTGNGRADGFRLDLRSEDPAVQAAFAERARALATVLAPLGGGTLTQGYSGADIGPIVKRGPPGLGMNHDLSTYWPIHHTDADTFDKIVLEDLQHNVGLMAAAAWWVAEEERLVPAP